MFDLGRREFITLLGMATVARPLAARAEPTKRHVIGWLGGSTPEAGARNLDALRQGLRDIGYLEGKNIEIVYRWANGDMSRQPALAGKQLALLLELVPRAKTIALLTRPTNPLHASMLQDAETAARSLGVKIENSPVVNAANIQAAFEKFKARGVDALVVLQDAMLFTQATEIVTLAAATRLPTIHGYREHVEMGGLMSYSVDVA